MIKMLTKAVVGISSRCFVKKIIKVLWVISRKIPLALGKIWISDAHLKLVQDYVSHFVIRIKGQW